MKLFYKSLSTQNLYFDILKTLEYHFLISSFSEIFLHILKHILQLTVLNLKDIVFEISEIKLVFHDNQENKYFFF